jgi:hypothetical protein
MVVSFLFALYIKILHTKLGFPEVSAHMALLMGVGITTVSWLLVTLFTRPTDAKVLRNFYRIVRPGGIGWNKVLKDAANTGEPIEEIATKGDLPRGILCMVLGCVAIYSAVFASGYFLYGQITECVICTILVVVGVVGIVKLWPKLELK